MGKAKKQPTIVTTEIQKVEEQPQPKVLTQEERISNLENYLDEQKLNITGYYKKGSKKDVRVMEVDGVITRHQINKISEILNIDDISVLVIVGKDDNDVLALAWIEK